MRKVSHRMTRATTRSVSVLPLTGLLLLYSCRYNLVLCNVCVSTAVNLVGLFVKRIWYCYFAVHGAILNKALPS